MPLRIAMLAYPAFLVVTAMSAKGGGGTGRLLEARAVSAETARRPESVGIKGGRATLARAVAKGVVVDHGDGRFFVNLAEYTRRRNRLLAILGAVAVIGGIGVVLLWAPWSTA